MRRIPRSDVIPYEFERGPVKVVPVGAVYDRAYRKGMLRGTVIHSRGEADPSEVGLEFGLLNIFPHDRRKRGCGIIDQFHYLGEHPFDAANFLSEFCG